MKFAKTVFRIAGVYGLLVTFPLYFLEQKLSADYPPAMNHPEYYYAFAGITMVWQILFFLIAGDPLRYRPLILLSVLEKLSLVPMIVVLLPRQQFPLTWLPPVMADLILAVLFCAAYLKTRKMSQEPSAS